MYRDLLDIYYDTEKPLTLDIPALCRKIIARTNEEATAVEQTLNEFFIKTPAGWYHDRCEEELDVYRKSSSQKSIAGKASAAARAEKRQQALNGNPTAVEQPSNGTPTNQEPITNNQVIPHTPQAGRKPSSAIALQTYLDECKKSGKRSIDEKHPVFDYATKTGIPQEFLRIQWLEFKYRYTLPDAKRYKAWQTVFDKSVRGNWFKLWYVTTGGEYALTTTGQQAKSAHMEVS